MSARTISAFAGQVIALLCLLGASGSFGPVHGGGDTPAANRVNEEREYRIKAAFLLHFVRYTTWPEESFEGAESPIVLTVIGPDPFGQVLVDTFRDEVVHGRKVEIAYSMEVEKARSGHLVFCGQVTRAVREDLLQQCRKHPVLLVGESPDFAEAGACVNFYIHEQKTRFEINTEALSAAELEMSPAVLKLAKVVRTRGSGA